MLTIEEVNVVTLTLTRDGSILQIETLVHHHLNIDLFWPFFYENEEMSEREPLVLRGWISELISQGSGPRPNAKPIMKVIIEASGSQVTELVSIPLSSR